MSKILQFVVYGKPEPQGSSRAFVRGGRAVITSDNPKMKGWRKNVAAIANDAAHNQGFSGICFGKHVPVSMDITFHFLKPKSVKKARTCPVVKPDLDKLQRAVLDALTGIAYSDDAQVVKIEAKKLYSDCNAVHICVSEIAT